MRKIWIEWTAACGTIAGFLALKLTHLTFRFGDGNAYIYMAQAIWHGHLPYRDFFLADPPFFVLLLAALRPIFGSHLIFFQAVPVFLEAGTAFLLFLLLKKWNSLFAALAPILYLFSFTVLSTSDYLTGVQLVVFCSVLALWLWEKNWPFFSGILWALGVLTKLYALPAFLAFLAYVWWKDRERFWKPLAGAAGAGAVVMLPFLVISLPQVWDHLVVHQFQRPPGNSRFAVWSFFWSHEWLIFLSGIAGAIFTKRWVLILPVGLLALFFALYQDLYFLYLDNIFFYLTALAIILASLLWQKNRKLGIFMLIGFVVTTLGSLMSYENDFRLRGRFQNAHEVASVVQTLPEHFPLYGSHEIAPLVSLLSGRPLYGNFIDTNGQAFASGALDRERVSADAATSGIYLIARITDLPEYGIKDSGYESFFSKEIFEKACARAAEFPSTSRENDNLIIVYRCKVENMLK